MSEYENGKFTTEFDAEDAPIFWAKAGGLYCKECASSLFNPGEVTQRTYFEGVDLCCGNCNKTMKSLYGVL